MSHKSRCVHAGAALRGWARDATIWSPENVIVRKDDLLVPHSELAMHVGAAGKPVLAWACRNRMCGIVWDAEDGCHFTDGTEGEVLSVGLRKAATGYSGLRRRQRRR